MADKSIGTKIDTLINIIKESEKDPQKFDTLIKSIESTIPVKGRKRMPKIDPFLNKRLRVSRINYVAVIDVIKFDKDSSIYDVNVISVETTDDKVHVKAGDKLIISRRELELTSRNIWL